MIDSIFFSQKLLLRSRASEVVIGTGSASSFPEPTIFWSFGVLTGKIHLSIKVRFCWGFELCSSKVKASKMLIRANNSDFSFSEYACVLTGKIHLSIKVRFYCVFELCSSKVKASKMLVRANT